MRIFISLFFLFKALFSFGQSGDSLLNYVNQNSTSFDCAKSSIRIADYILDKWQKNEFLACEAALNYWEQSCGQSEVLCRVKLLIQKDQNKELTTITQLYLDRLYYIKYLNRINDANLDDFGYRYYRYPNYYEYIPLRHNLDSLCIKKAESFLQNGNISQDEELIYLLFSNKKDEFQNRVYYNEYTTSFVAKTIRKNEFKNPIREQIFEIKLLAGIYSPLGKKRIFSNSANFGLSGSITFAQKFRGEVRLNVRLNTNDKPFLYFANNDTNTVNSASSLAMSLNVLYRLYESRKLIINPRIGLGIDNTSSGLSNNARNSENRKYYSPTTFQGVVGIVLGFPIGKKGQIGLDINGHFTPYALDKDLLSTFHKTAASASIFYKF